MKALVTLLIAAALLSGLGPALAPDPVAAEGVVIVEMKPPGGGNGPFPIGWAVINVPRGEVTMMAILPANTTIADESGEHRARLVFEGWLADLAPPHRCPPRDPAEPTDSGAELGDARIAGGTEVPDATDVPICGSRRSSETGFRGFPGLINRTFQHTYFPVSQGILHKVGPPLGEWQFYAVRHKTNMGLVPYDVAGVTVEPPGTGAPLRDYDPRPNPVIALVGRIPRLNAPSSPEGGNEERPTETTVLRERPQRPISKR